ncbi:MAG: glycosyltransferase family 2 protein [Patescibacteria group bacterium]
MVSIVILNYNGRKLLGECLKSVLALKYADKEVIFLDNASTDDSVEYVLKNFSEVRMVVNKENSGYAGGANKGIEVSRGEFVFILNPDIVFESDYLDVLMRRVGRDAKIGAIIGKLRKYDFEHHKKTNLIDSAGLLMFKNRRCVDRGQGEEDLGQYDTAEEVFGITGAAPLYRRSALEDIKVCDEIFDNDFFMYKEDVDVSWRLRLAGWKCFYEPEALAYHGRGTGVLSRDSSLKVAKNRGALSKFQRFYSYKNERLMRVKNELLPHALRDLPHILFKEVLMSGWIVLREQFLFKSVWHFIKQLPRALKKRREIMKAKNTSAKEMRKWFV